MDKQKTKDWIERYNNSVVKAMTDQEMEDILDKIKKEIIERKIQPPPGYEPYPNAEYSHDYINQLKAQFKCPCGEEHVIHQRQIIKCSCSTEFIIGTELYYKRPTPKPLKPKAPPVSKVIENFLEMLDENGWNLAVLNTYAQSKSLRYFIMVAENSPGNKYMKREGLVKYIDTTFNDIIAKVSASNKSKELNTR